MFSIIVIQQPVRKEKENQNMQFQRERWLHNKNINFFKGNKKLRSTGRCDLTTKVTKLANLKRKIIKKHLQAVCKHPSAI